MKKILTLTFFIVILFLLTVGDLIAIPAFARKYNMSCKTCHSPFPHLKPYGEEFAGNGFVIPEEDKDRDFVIAGDDLLRLNKTFPFAVRFDAYAQVDSDNDVSNDLQTPWGLKLLSGGPLAKNIGYYFYFYRWHSVSFIAGRIRLSFEFRFAARTIVRSRFFKPYEFYIWYPSL